MGLGDFVTNLFGSKNTATARGYNVNSNAYQYGGAPGGAQRAARGYQNSANAAQARQGVQVNYGQADQDRALQMQARAGQGAVAQSALARALGQTPSIAQMQADRQMGQATSAQASMAASARGAGALANAQRNAANNVANTQSDISGQAQVNAATERLAAEQSAANQFGAMRGGDLGSQGQSAQQAQAQAGFNDAQSGRNDQMQMGYDQLANQVNTTQLGAQMNQQAQQSANTMGAQSINAGVAGQNASMNQANAMNVVGMAQGAAGGIAGLATKATGGATSGGTPYLVGENGPELVVPQKNGYVIPHDQTLAALRGASPSVLSSLFARGDRAAPCHSLASVLGHGHAGGGCMYARADGGPIDGAIASGQAAPPPAADEAGLLEGFAPVQSTWGGTPAPDAGQQQRDYLADVRARMQPLDDASKALAEGKASADETAKRVNATVADIDNRDRDVAWNADYKTRHGQAMTPAEEDAAIEARYRQGLDRKRPGMGTPPEKGSLAAVLGKMGSDTQGAAKGVDTAYHGGAGHYAPPALIPIMGGRAMGGPMSGAAAPSFEVIGPGGGENVLGSEKAMSNFATQYGRQGGASPMAYGGAREEGGPVLGPSQKAAEDVTQRSQNMGTDLTNMGAPLSQIAPGLSFVLGANGLAAHASAAAMRADDAAERDRIKAAQDEQVAQDAERAKMNAAERNASAPAPAVTGASTPLARPEDRQKSRMGFLLNYLLGPEHGR